MAGTNSEGIRQRAANGQSKAPGTDTTVKVASEADKLSDQEHPGGSAHHPVFQALRIVALMTYFLGSCAFMNTTQFIVAPMYFYDREWYYAWMAMTKQHFTLLLVTMQQWWSPTTIRISGDASVRGQLKKAADGRLETDFPERVVIISNHELYTDWLYLWWFSYTARMHGHIYIILKESLKYVPVLGWGMQFFSFIFLSRNWTTDQARFTHRLDKLKRRDQNGHYNPMWMLIFPEGTNLSRNARRKSQAWAKKQGIEDLQHAILPRSTGLHFCLEQLGDTVEWVYDCTLAYEGIPRGSYGQDIYTLKAIYLQGRAPASVNMHWRRFAVADIPTSPSAFDEWVLKRWREKDELLEHYMQNGRFPGDVDAPIQHMPVSNGAGLTKPFRQEAYVETDVRPETPWEFLQIFVPPLAMGLVLHLIRKFFIWLLVVLHIKSRS